MVIISTPTHRKIKSRKYKGFRIKFSEYLTNGRVHISAVYGTQRYKVGVFGTEGKDEDTAFEKIKKIIDKKEKGPIPKFKPHCWDCTVDLTEENLYPYSHIIDRGKKYYFCLDCSRMDMMVDKDRFEKELLWNDRCCDHKATFIKGKIVWKRTHKREEILFCTKCMVIIRESNFLKHKGHKWETIRDE